jgi:cell division protein FtsN
MRRFILFAILITSFLSSCKYYANHRYFSRDNIDTLLDTKNYKALATDTSKTKVVEPVASVVNVPKQPTGFGYGNDKYYMIVGSFLNQNLAEKYAEKIQQMGYHTQIIQSSSSYYRVSAESFSNYKEGISQIAEFREKIGSQAWLHVKK